MNHKGYKRALSGVLCMAMIAATVLGAAGCSGKPENPSAQTETMTIYSAADTPHSLGEGETTFSFSVVHLDGEEVLFEISTDEATVGAALAEVGLITGEDGPYGMMVTVVNGEVHRYETDKTYWSFYIDGVYAMTGVDETDIESGKSYALRAEQI